MFSFEREIVERGRKFLLGQSVNGTIPLGESCVTNWFNNITNYLNDSFNQPVSSAICSLVLYQYPSFKIILDLKCGKKETDVEAQ